MPRLSSKRSTTPRAHLIAHRQLSGLVEQASFDTLPQRFAILLSARSPAPPPYRHDGINMGSNSHNASPALGLVGCTVTSAGRFTT